jgi:ATP phosphoribosyltransferase regulatory subunit
LQFGAEIYGHSGLEADLEIMQLAIQSLRTSGLQSFHLDLSDARILPALLQGHALDPEVAQAITQSLANKDISAVRKLAQQLPAVLGQALQALVHMYGDVKVLAEARKAFAAWPQVLHALDQLEWLSSHLNHNFSIDLADLRGFSYYSGPRFSVFVPGSSDALVRGGRYDEVGAVFGRKRPAAGFSMDIKALVGLLPHPQPQAAIRAPWREDASLIRTIAQLRAQGHTVVCLLPGHESEIDEFHCDRELIEQQGQWTVRPLITN